MDGPTPDEIELLEKSCRLCLIPEQDIDLSNEYQPNIPYNNLVTVLCNIEVF